MCNRITKLMALCLSIMMIFMCMPALVTNAASLDSSKIKTSVLSKVGQSYPSGYCLKFVEECYQNLGAVRPYSCCASKSGNLYIKSTRSDNIPVGATVYFGKCGGGPCKSCGSSYYGHVGIYVGDGYFVHATGGKVQKSTLSSWSNKYRGWGYCGNFTLTGSSQDSCNCSTGYAGDYIVSTSSLPLNIRNSHGGGSVIGSIPRGAKVYVSKANGSWAHVTYNGISGLCSMEYLSKVQNQNLDIRVSCWFSNTEMGNAISDCRTQDNLYLCYKLYDATTGKLLNQLENCNYKVKETVYNPDGSEHFSYTYDHSDYNWIKVNPTADGEYRGRIELSGDKTGSVECTIHAKALNIAARCWFSRDKMGEKTDSGYFDDGMVYLCYEIIDRNSGQHWNEVDRGSYTVKETIYNPDGSVCHNYTYDCSDYDWIGVNAEKPGIYRGVVEISGDRNGRLESTFEVKERKTYTITYQGNGGSDYLTPQSKKEGKVYTIASGNGQRKRVLMLSANGGTFASGQTQQSCTYAEKFQTWNTKADGSGTDYPVGSSYNKNAGLTLYAQYQPQKAGSLPTPSRASYQFAGWNTKADGTGIWVTQDSLLTTDIIVYAQWKKTVVPTSSNIQKPTIMPVKTPESTIKATTDPKPTSVQSPTKDPEPTAGMPVKTSAPTVTPTPTNIQKPAQTPSSIVTPAPTIVQIPTVAPSKTPILTPKPPVTIMPTSSQAPSLPPSFDINDQEKVPISTDKDTSNKIIPGDTDEDGKITLNDAVFVLKMALKITPEPARIHVDIDGDGKISLLDAQIVLKAALKIISIIE